MFDRYTAELIAGVPRLHGMLPVDLPKSLTEAYVRVSMARSALQDRPEELSAIAKEAIWDDLDSLAAAYETIVLSDDEIDDSVRAATAFVAATAHHGRFLARVWIEQRDSPATLNGHSVPAEVSATLLYMLADANADAAEMASQIQISDAAHQADRQLLAAIRHLGRSEFGSLRNLPVDLGLGAQPSPDIGSQAIGILLVEALTKLARRMLANSRAGWRTGDFERIASLAASTFVVEDQFGNRREAVSVYAGPSHIARLLARIEPVLQLAALVNVAAPARIDVAQWETLLERIAGRRPVLWRNHLSAIEQGLLERGVSAVVTFPTGAGKSTISELKVATALLDGGDVLYLVPTLALMDQTARALRPVFPDFPIVAQRGEDPDPRAALDSPKVLVMTPESCLATLGVRPEFVSELALVVFDEAHLLDGGDNLPDQRSLDAMLCLLSVTAANPQADVVLISAMVRNTHELAAWIESSTGRQTLPLDMDWKPTRQARAAVLYRSEEIAQLQARLDAAFEQSTNLGAPAAVRNSLWATPFGFFSLRHSWESRKIADYLLLPLLNHKVLLSSSGRRPRPWHLVPNSNAVAAAIASASASSGLKVLVFAQSVGWAVSIANQIALTRDSVVELNPAERRLLERSVEELGDPNALYLEVSDDGTVGPVAVHHGLLLPTERRLHESLYSRASGIPVMVATSTIAQGMNLPSEVVVIAGDTRFDPELDRMAQLKPHEILNAAGRAGRAGQHANGLVLVVPSSVIDFDGTTREMHEAWNSLQEIFSQGDQCLDIRDPLETVLDALDDSEPGELGAYLLRRISSHGDSPVSPEQVLTRSFAAFRARRSGKDDWLAGRLDVVESSLSSVEELEWQTNLAAATGTAISTIKLVDLALETAPPLDGSIPEWISWFFDVLRTNPTTLQDVLRRGNRAMFKGAGDKLGEWDIDAAQAVDFIEEHLSLWMAGATFVEIENLAQRLGIAKASSNLAAARKFVLRIVPDLAHVFSLPALVLRARDERSSDNLLSSTPAILADCVREGLNTEMKLRIRLENPLLSRVRVHQVVEAA
ncbi:RAD3-like DEAD/DEAH box helicase [Microterricola gilva]|uniref:RAD3-like DEAD/DEAH box helicase n=1 Tax=Microterricola gilva TaxID=393267 RepID=A0A4Q8AMH5_9MICO|nr:DEAD/DEAH box helicase [Microterricola gilva]RZU65135.1 RAD3-like DEAD/DEAH box helicase [Microterricola gilva]